MSSSSLPTSARRTRALVLLLVAMAVALAGLTAPGFASTSAPASSGVSAGASAVGSERPVAAGKKAGKKKGLTCKQLRAKGKKGVKVKHVKGKNGKTCKKKKPKKPSPTPTPAPTPAPATAPGSGSGSGSAGTVSAVQTTDGCLVSVPDPGTTEPVSICYTIFQPQGSGPGARVPLLMHSHGWGGSRTKDAAAFATFLDAGYGVLSFDQRGFGESGGQAYVENPDVEGHDVLALIKLIAAQPWVQLDGPGDPRMGAIGGSYGGGYQFLGAFESLRLGGKPVFDALAPEITWNDLEESLAPEGVVRTAWAGALTAAGLPTDALPQSVLTAFAQGVLQGSFPDSLKPFFAKNGPQFHTEAGRVLDIPVLFGQGTTDSLFPLEQGLQNFQTAITAEARKQSIFIGYNGGHVLPAVYPIGVNVTSDPCSKKLGGGTFEDLSLRFFNEKLKGMATGLTGYGTYHLATPDAEGTCLDVSSVQANTDLKIPTVNAVTGPSGAALGTLVAAGPITIAGTPSLTGMVTSLGTDNRTFLGLAVGTDPATAHLVQNNVLPLREQDLVATPAPRQVALPSVAVTVPAGQNLYLLASPTDTIFAGMNSRTPGLITIADGVVHLPVVR